MLQVMGWIAEEESKKKTERVKLAIRKPEGQKALSYKGNKWGRKSIETERLKQDILELKSKGLSVREITRQVYYYDKHGNKKQPSSSVVFKIIKDKKEAVE